MAISLEENEHINYINWLVNLSKWRHGIYGREKKILLCELLVARSQN